MASNKRDVTLFSSEKKKDACVLVRENYVEHF